jgi:aquaporin Z
MSTNPARTFGPALYGGYWNALWIYFIAPPMGMLAAAEVFLLVRQCEGPYCAKLHHRNDKRCIFPPLSNGLNGSGDAGGPLCVKKR